MDFESYVDFSLRLHNRLTTGRVPAEGTIEVTRRCPLSCAHCYNNVPIDDRQARTRELTLAEHRRIVDGIADSGCLWLLYTGGEPFVRRDFPEIYTHAKRRGMLVTIFTNGTLVTRRVADLLAEWRPFSIEVTLYGRTRETYERLTGVPGSYDRCLRGLELLLDRKLPVKLKSMAVSVNRHEIDDMRRFAADLGVEFRFDAMINPRIDCSTGPLAVRLTPEEVVAFDLQDPKRMAEWKVFCGRFKGVPARPDGACELYACGAGITSFSIDPEGRLSICALDRAETYDLRAGSFPDGWAWLQGTVRSRLAATLTKCARCDLRSMCGMCPANGRLECGDAETPVDFLCRVAHLRAYAFGVPVPPHGSCDYCPGGGGFEELQGSLRNVEALVSRSPASRDALNEHGDVGRHRR